MSREKKYGADFQKKALRLMEHMPELLFGHSGDDPSATDEAITAALAETGALLGVSRAYAMLDEANGRYLRNTHEWVDGSSGPAMYSWPLHEYAKDLPSLKPLMAGEDAAGLRPARPQGAAGGASPPVVFKDFFACHTVEAPPDLRRVLSLQSVDSVLLAPLLREGRWIGLTGFDSCGKERVWLDEEILILRHLARLVAAALERREHLATRRTLARIRMLLVEGEAEAAPDLRIRAPLLADNAASLQEVERRTIVEALELHMGNRMQAAKHLGLTWPSLNRRCTKLEIDVPKRTRKKR